MSINKTIPVSIALHENSCPHVEALGDSVCPASERKPMCWSPGTNDIDCPTNDAYGNTSCRVFKGGRGTKLERFLPKDQYTQRKLLNFENWCSEEVSKSAKI